MRGFWTCFPGAANDLMLYNGNGYGRSEFGVARRAVALEARA